VNLNQAILYNLEELQSSLNLLSDEEYVMKMEILSGASLGQHYRHLTEFLLCLKESQLNGIVDYDARQRDPELESSRLNAVERISTLMQWIAGIQDNRVLKLQVSYGYEKEERTELQTDLFRELAYNMEHCVHHMALIKIGFRKLDKHKSLSSHFGVASSTTRHQHSTKA
jgi:hypothetical protein